jgi:hypothetical protein
MRRRLTLLLASAAVVVAGCGSSSSSTAPEQSHPPAGPVAGAHVLALVPIHAVAGQVSGLALPLDTPAQVTQFVEQFPPAALVRQRVRGALERALGRAPGQRPDHVVGAVVASGCDVPKDVVVIADGHGGVRIVAEEASSPDQPRECLVPVTTVALVEVPGP